MATLDKEMAEEKCIDLETQLTELKDKLEGNNHSARDQLDRLIVCLESRSVAL